MQRGCRVLLAQWGTPMSQPPSVPNSSCWGCGVVVGGGHLKHFQPIENPRSTDIISLWADRLAAWPGPDTAAQHP